MGRRFLYLMAFLALCAPAAAQPPTLPQAFGRGIPGAGGVAEGSDLFRVDVPIQRYPDAQCADGSPVALYVRSARSQMHRNDWIVYLQGGGTCNSGAQCQARWLGRDGNFGANKLSSRFAPARGIAAGGILSPDTRNPFADWNHVFVYYCSSDGWAGTVRDQVTEALRAGDPVQYRIHFLGARIVDAVIDRLRGGLGAVAYEMSGGQRRTMPDLDDASTLLFAGSSAGASGVRTHADRLAATLQAGRPHCPGASCSLRFAAVMDASYGLSTEGLDHEGSLACGAEAALECTYEASMRLRWFEVLKGFRRGIADSSCEAFHAPLGDTWRCADGAHVQDHHLATPYFIRADLQDRLIMGNTIEAGFAYQGMPLDQDLYGLLQEEQLRAVGTAAVRAEEAPPGSVPGKPGVFGPQCGHHETLRSDGPTFRTSVLAADGSRLTLPQVLSNWLAGREPSSAIAAFSGSGTASGCAPR